MVAESECGSRKAVGRRSRGAKASTDSPSSTQQPGRWDIMNNHLKNVSDKRESVRLVTLGESSPADSSASISSPSSSKIFMITKTARANNLRGRSSSVGQRMLLPANYDPEVIKSPRYDEVIMISNSEQEETDGENNQPVGLGAEQ